MELIDWIKKNKITEFWFNPTFKPFMTIKAMWTGI